MVSRQSVTAPEKVVAANNAPNGDGRLSNIDEEASNETTPPVAASAAAVAAPAANGDVGTLTDNSMLAKIQGGPTEQRINTS